MRMRLRGIKRDKFFFRRSKKGTKKHLRGIGKGQETSLEIEAGNRIGIDKEITILGEVQEEMIGEITIQIEIKEIEEIETEIQIEIETETETDTEMTIKEETKTIREIDMDTDLVQESAGTINEMNIDVENIFIT